MAVYYDGNDNVLTLTGLKDYAAGTWMNSATVTVTVVTQAGAAVTGQTWPTTMSYVAASNGNYRCTLEDAMATTPGTKLVAKVTADGGSGLKFYRELEITVLAR